MELGLTTSLKIMITLSKVKSIWTPINLRQTFYFWLYFSILFVAIFLFYTLSLSLNLFLILIIFVKYSKICNIPWFITKTFAKKKNYFNGLQPCSQIVIYGKSHIFPTSLLTSLLVYRKMEKWYKYCWVK